MGDLENITMQDSSRELITKSHSTGFFRTAGKVLLTGAAVIAAYLGMTGTAKAEQGCSDGAHYLQPADSNYSLDCHAMGIMVYPGEKPIDALRSFQHTKKQEWLPLAIKYANQVYGETAMNTPATEQEVMRICVDLPSTAVVECTPNSQYTPPAPPIDKDDSKRGTPPTDTTTPGNPKEECVGSQYRGSTEYNALETDLMAYIPRLQAQIQETRPTNYQDIVNILSEHGAVRDGDSWNNSGARLQVSENTYTVPDNETLNPIDNVQHRLMVVKVGDGCYSDAGDYVARIKFDEKGNVLDVNWGRKGIDLETKNMAHSGGLSWITSYASAEAGDPWPIVEGSLEVARDVTAILGACGVFNPPASGGGSNPPPATPPPGEPWP